MGHLKDEDLVKYLQRCAQGLVPNGVIIVKENMASGDDDVYDPVDSSVTRYGSSSHDLSVS